MFKKNNKDFTKTLNEFTSIINNTDRNIIVDGWFKKENLIEIENKKIEFWLIYAEPHICLERFKKRVKKSSDPNYTIEIINQTLQRVLENKYEKVIIYDTAQPVEVNEIEFKRILNRDKVVEFQKIIKYIEENFPNKFYHGYNLPFGLKIEGLKVGDGDFITEQTIREISKHVDFRGKTVLDLGCYSGFFCFKAKQLGAKHVSGLDCYDKILYVAKTLNEAFGLNINFVKANIETAKWGNYDIIFIFSIIHHTDTPFYILKKVFTKANELVMIELDLPRTQNEMEFSEKTTRAHDRGYLIRISAKSMTQFADGQGFDLFKRFPSTKYNREILIYKRRK